MTEEPLLEFERGTDINPIQQWKDFTRKLYELMMQVNSKSLVNKNEWEAPHQPGRKINTLEVDNWIEYANYRNADSVKVYPFKKEGIRIDVALPSNGFGSKYSFSIIKSCKDDFHRDWNKDGICVRDVPKSQRDYPFDRSDYYDDSTEEMQRKERAFDANKKIVSALEEE